MRPFLFLPALPLLAAACSAPLTDGSSESRGRSDVGSVDEIGPLELGTTRPVAHPTRASAYRVVSYGGLDLTLDLSSDGDGPPPAALKVEGPLDGDGDTVSAGLGPLFAASDPLDPTHLDVRLTSPGVYRVIVRPLDGVRDAALALTSECTSPDARDCHRPELAIADLLARLRASDRSSLEAALAARVRRLLPAGDTSDELAAQLHRLFAATDPAGIERFPRLRLADLGQLRPLLLDLLPMRDHPPDAKIDGELTDLLGHCDDARPQPAPLDQVAGVAYGHYPDRALTLCQVTQSNHLADVLTALAVGNGSVVRYQGQELRSPLSLAQALVASGHVIEARNERVYANFLSFALDLPTLLNDPQADARGTNLKWPVWMDTGVDLGADGSLTIPVGHSQQAWRIVGPDVDARVAFFLGAYQGVRFYPLTDERPAWTGITTATRFDTGSDRARVLSTFDVATRYLQRARIETGDLPADGYGVLGVCNDANAVIEYLTSNGSISTYPLLRSSELDQRMALDDGLDQVVRRLPHDAEVAAPALDVVRRVLAMTPLDLDSPLLVDDALHTQLRHAAGLLDGAQP